MDIEINQKEKAEEERKAKVLEQVLEEQVRFRGIYGGVLDCSLEDLESSDRSYMTDESLSTHPPWLYQWSELGTKEQLDLLKDKWEWARLSYRDLTKDYKNLRAALSRTNKNFIALNNTLKQVQFENQRLAKQLEEEDFSERLSNWSSKRS